MAKFNTGDTVCLMSGKQEMTVDHTDTDGQGVLLYVCVWHDKDGKPQMATYYEAALRLAKKRGPATPRRKP